jgi:hypothetical protein
MWTPSKLSWAALPQGYEREFCNTEWYYPRNWETSYRLFITEFMWVPDSSRSKFGIRVNFTNHHGLHCQRTPLGSPWLSDSVYNNHTLSSHRLLRWSIMMLPSIGVSTRKLAALSYARVSHPSMPLVIILWTRESEVRHLFLGLWQVFKWSVFRSSIIFSSHLSIRIPGSEM